MAGALAFTYAMGIVLGAVPYPPAALQDLVVRVAPGGLATAAIDTFQHWAMRLLAIGIHLGLLGLGGYVGSLFATEERPRVRARAALAVALSLFVLACALALTGQAGTSWPAFLVYAVVAYGYARIASGTSLGRIADPQVREGETPLDAMRRSRRRFLGRGVVIGGVAVLGGGGLLRLLLKRTPKVTIVPASQPFSAPAADPAFPDVVGLSSEITANADFYNVDIDFLKPSIDAARWRLAISGMVDAPYTLDFNGLQASFEVVEMAHTLSCISNDVGGDLISTAVWRGVRLKDVLAKAGLKPTAVEVVFQAADGYSESLPIAKATQDTTLVVFGMNGEALPKDHGFPVRIIVPGLYGMKNPKWITSITVVDHTYRGYWVVRGWDPSAAVKTESRIDVPAAAAVVHLPSKLAGVAWAGDRHIAKVEVSDDQGQTWRPAMLKRELSPVAWRLWAADVTPGTGPRRVLVRATDGTGAVQTAAYADPHPSGASGYDFATYQVQ